ncbi:TFIIIC transcription initiation factor complex subunits Tfc3 [Aspergillus bombycis]|uniref:TFIIIC transcription initiation factor complex subunits Tfc3 n=1 Tax=Aspergillus bombycis TaxID=109264 RepID=A0A1F8A2D4_9EURO|nr:TFIIIC transcription initiation factor complex subunits Tfc3 [Aspergillus bombycis]OGM45890.1 TFIIIC transcription initiation factor complex subunits Tfc3 [Aspergillus bombycis]
MAPSLRELIDFLLAEIALCGDQGASPSDILTFINTFYAKAAQDASTRSHVVDRRFQEKVWSWLARNPEVSIGENREWNALSFSDVERRVNDAPSSEHTAQNPIRVFVSKERTWLAITGHEPDENKLLATEFALLSIIASRKSNGIAQTELVKLSGQDKRSVPKRTDQLQQKGYIEKRAIQIKSTRTSLCTLRKFMQAEQSSAETTKDQSSGQPQVIDYKEFSKQLFSILREHEIISRVDLKKILGFADRWRWRILSRALRKFERIGVLMRVKAMSQFSENDKHYFACVKLIREPTEKDLELFHEFSRGISTNLEQDDNAELDEDVDPNDATRESPLLNNGETLNVMKREEDTDEAGRILPVWSPDQTIHNLILDVVEKAGTEGIMNQQIIRKCFGGFYRRPLENTMSRLVECWQLSQPLHLRHMAIVRDTVLNRTITQYNHFTATNFAKLVETGESAWEAVEFTPKNPKVDKIRAPPVDAQPELDEYGLPVAVPAKELLKNGDVSLLECIVAVDPSSYNVTNTDAAAIRLKDGTYALHCGQTKAPAGSRRLATSSDILYLTIKRRKLPRDESEKFQGMSEIEKLRALGLDETWTEYNALLIKRPHSGVYVTPRGRRRPTGKRQGRPRISRIAVFKSPRLSSFPWFMEEAEAGDQDDGSQQPSREQTVEEAVEENAEDTPVPTPVPTAATTSRALDAPEDIDATPSRGTKRRSRHPVSKLESSPATMRTPKQRRITDFTTKANSVPIIATGKSEGIPAGDSRQDSPDFGNDDKTQGKPLKRKRAESPSQNSQEVVTENSSRESNVHATQVLEVPSKKPREAVRNEGNKDATGAKDNLPTDHAPVNDLNGSAPMETEECNTAPTDRAAVDKTPASQAVLDGREVNANPLERPDTEKLAENSRARENVKEKKGSVGFIRRKIILDIVEKAGGAFPMGTEIWYPFATAWRKTKYKETPDLRTIKATVKHIIDAGKLRQLTFSGKDNKGVMVTKNIIAKPDMRADDPLVMDMQKKMLAAGSRHYIPHNVDYDPEMTKTGARRVTFGKDGRDPNTYSKLPVESALTVQLQYKPGFVVAQEKRKGLSVQKRLLQRIGEGKENHSKVVRLLSLQRPLAQDSITPGMTAATRPDQIANQGGRRIKPGRRPSVLQTQDGSAADGGRRMRRLWIPISSMAPYAMLMNSRQTFYANTGTFSTDGGLAALRAARHDQKKARELPRTLEATNDKTPELPHSLDDLFSQTRRRQVDYSESADPRSNRFFYDTNVIMRWELQNEGLLDKKSADLWYINQTVQDSFDSAGIEGNVRFDIDEPELPARPLPEPRVTRQRGRRSDFSAQPGTFGATTLLGSNRLPISRTLAPGLARNRRLEKLNASMAAGDEFDTTIQPAGSRAPARRNRTGYQLPHLLTQRIMIAIVVVRALAGGYEGKIVDWTLFSSSFPDYDPLFIQAKGKYVLSKNRLQLAKMQSDFQERYLEAYSDGQVPPINYDDLEGYDWEWVVDWANAQLDVPKSEKLLPDLPATREQFDSVFEIREELPSTLDDIYQTTQPLTINRKRTLFATVPFALPLIDKHKTPTPPKQDLSRLDVVKSWIRANVVTPEEAYRPAEARQALSYMGSFIENAIESLVTERIISMGNRGRITPGRNYDITDHFLHALGRKRLIESTQLRRAARFKTQMLDPELQSEGKFEIKYNAEDGDILAVINLVAARRVTLRPRDAPRDKYGLTEGGYLTRQIDRDKLRFAVELYPVEKTYVYGNPIEKELNDAPAPCPPRATNNGTAWVPEKIPLWCDIHGGFIKLLWDLAVAAVAGCVASRPGLSAASIASMIKPTMGAWEIEHLLKWMTEIGAMRKEGPSGEKEAGWTLQEWWWMILC